MVALCGNKWLERVAQHDKHGEHKDPTTLGHGKSGLDLLSDPRSAVIKAFFDFVGENNGTLQLVSLQTYFRQLKQLYRRSSNSELDKAIYKDANAYLKYHFASQKSACQREKAVPTAFDFTELLRLHYGGDTTLYPDERQRVQQALLMRVMAYSALRPSSATAARKRKRNRTGGAGVERHKSRKRDGNIMGARADEEPGRVEEVKEEKEEEEEAADDSADGSAVPEARLKYGDFRVFLVCDKTGQSRLCIQPTYKHYKGDKRRRQQKTFTFWTQPNVTHCPAAHLIALALHDGAFKDPLLTSVKSLLSLRVPPKEQLELYWSQDCEHRCILRESTDGEPDKELSADQARYRLRRLGENKGSQKRLVHYSLRVLNLNTPFTVVFLRAVNSLCVKNNLIVKFPKLVACILCNR